MKTLGERIRELRDRKDLSLRELAKKMGVSAAFLSDIELGRRFPSEATLHELAKHLRVEVEDLRSYDSRPPIEDLKRISERNPKLGFALRKVVDETVNVDELVEFIEKKSRGSKK